MNEFPMTPMQRPVLYEMCARCWHFVEPNDAEPNPYFTIAAFVHLDDGTKEHDHDAVPSGRMATLDEWQRDYPELFVEYADGKIGPNSAYFVARW